MESGLVIIGLIVFMVSVIAVAVLHTKSIKKLEEANGIVFEVMEEQFKIMQSIADVLDEDLEEDERTLQYYSEFGYKLTKAHPSDAGMDIISAEDYILKPTERHLFSTGIYGILPQNTDVTIMPRSGLAYKHGIQVLAGEVDEPYTGQIGVILINHGQGDFVVTKGDRIAQLVCRSVIQNHPQEITKKVFDVLKENKDRGDGSFGSSGK